MHLDNHNDVRKMSRRRYTNWLKKQIKTELFCLVNTVIWVSNNSTAAWYWRCLKYSFHQHDNVILVSWLIFLYISMSNNIVANAGARSVVLLNNY